VRGGPPLPFAAGEVARGGGGGGLKATTDTLISWKFLHWTRCHVKIKFGTPPMSSRRWVPPIG